jgi:hypothetical protein
MDPKIVSFVNNHFTTITTFKTNTNTHYLRGNFNNNQYTISCQTFYIVTKKINDIEEEYIGVYQTPTEVLDTLNKILNNQPVVINELGKLVSQMIK